MSTSNETVQGSPDPTDARGREMQLAQLSADERVVDVSPSRDFGDNAVCCELERWIKQRWSGEELNVRMTFVEAQFRKRLSTYKFRAIVWRVAQILTWIVITVLGLLITVFAGYHFGHGFIIVAGAAIATLTTASNALRPGTEADGYNNGRRSLRDDGWALLNDIDPYRQLPHTEPGQVERYRLFVSRVHEIVDTKRTATTLNLDASGPPAPQGR